MLNDFIERIDLQTEFTAPVAEIPIAEEVNSIDILTLM